MRPQFFLNKNDTQPAGSTEGAPVQSGKKKSGVLMVLSFLVMLLLLVGLIVLGKLYLDSQNKLVRLEDQSLTKVTNFTDEEIKLLVQKVGKHIVLPNEQPQIVTVANVEALKISQPFFRTAENGDKLLVYTSRVILYRPTTDKVIDIAQIRAAGEASGSGIAVTQTPTPTLESPSPVVSQTVMPEPTVGQ